MNNEEVFSEKLGFPKYTSFIHTSGRISDKESISTLSGALRFQCTDLSIKYKLNLFEF